MASPFIISVDVLVVGLGPAGASAATAASKAGAKVLAIDRKVKAGLPVQCAEFVPMMMGMEVPDLGNSRIQAIDEMRTFIEAEEETVTPDFRGQMVDRARFDQHLVDCAIAQGAECRLSTPVREIRGDGTVVIGDGDIVRAKVIIGADGPRSRVGAAIGAVNEDIVESRQITVALNAPYFATDIFLRADIAGGYAWLFPRGNVCNLGLGVEAAHKADLKPLLDELHGRLVAEGRVGPEILKFTGGPIPVGGMVGPVGALGKIPVLLAGDAAGLVNPVTGAGIPAAVMSGQMAGEAARAYCNGDNEAADDYGDELATIFGPSLKLALHRRQQLLDLYRQPRLPGTSELKKGWIAFPEYWSADDRSFEIQTRHQEPEAAIAS